MNVPETEQLIKKIQFYQKNTKAPKSSKAHFIREILWPERESGRVGDQCRIQETPGWSTRVGTYALVIYS